MPQLPFLFVFVIAQRLYSLKILLVDISDVLFTDLLPFVMFNFV